MSFKKVAGIIWAASLFCTVMAEDFIVDKIKPSVAIYQPPYSFSINYEKRKNDLIFSFPLLNLTMDTYDGFRIVTAPEVKVQYKKFWGKVGLEYELYNPSYEPFSQITEYSGFLITGYNFLNGSVALKNECGKKRWTDFQACVSRELDFSQSIIYNLYLIDNLIVRSSCNAELKIDVLPQQQFASYQVMTNIPFVYNWFYGESCLLGSIFYTQYLNSSGRKKFQIDRSYDSLTGRVTLNCDNPDKFCFFTSIEMEQRLYAFRCLNIDNNIFLSLFGNAAMGLNQAQDLKLLYQAGVGIGYNLYGCVPFTFQAGINQDNKIVMYLNVVAKVM